MKVCAAQLRSIAGDLEKNIARHLAFVDAAVSHGAGLIFFPELSLTGYEPKLAKGLATTQDDPLLAVLQRSSETRRIIIGAGVPTSSPRGVHISMIIFQPGRARLTYSKQQLAADERPYFVNGEEQVIVTAGTHGFAPAICYESLQASHAERAVRLGCGIYLASVAKSERGVNKAYAHYPTIARQYSMIVIMANGLGPCDDFVGAGQSAAWNRRGELAAKLGAEGEGLVIIDALTEVASVFEFEP